MRSLLALAVLGPSLAAAEPRPQVLVELFTSEGCSSCPPADAALAALARDPALRSAEVIPLELHVDYWNHLGWADPFSAPEFTARQEEYAQLLGGDGLYTPQMVIDGWVSAVASPGSLRRGVEKAAGRSKARLEVLVAAARTGLEVVVRPPAGLSGRLMVALSEDRLSSKVERGENRGRTLAHAPVARLLVTEGPVATEHHVRLGLSPSWKRDQLRVVAFVQEPGGRVVAVGTAVVPPGRS
ncbi:MAG: DUF1223 domain-containing protein [Myxococcaceae bacterium]|nr:MAG: DUF1223 domain-containing protein [Myxococcaceae bacterium]